MSLAISNKKKDKERVFLEEEVALSLCPSAVCFQTGVQPSSEVSMFLF